MNNSFKLLFKMADELKPLGFLKEYSSDLSVDKEVLVKTKDKTPFFWAVGTHGTWLLTKTKYLEHSSQEWINSCSRCLTTYINCEYKTFYFDGSELNEIQNLEEAKKFLIHGGNLLNQKRFKELLQKQLNYAQACLEVNNFDGVWATTKFIQQMFKEQENEIVKRNRG